MSDQKFCTICDKPTEDDFERCNRHLRTITFSEHNPPKPSIVLTAISSMPVEDQEYITKSLNFTHNYGGFNNERSPPVGWILSVGHDGTITYTPSHDIAKLSKTKLAPVEKVIASFHAIAVNLYNEEPKVYLNEKNTD